MSALSRFKPSISRSIFAQHHRHMASASASADPIQKLFVEKIREFKTTNKGLDAGHEKALNDEMLRLRRVYRVEDEAKLTQMDHKFSNEHNVNLYDIDEHKEVRAKIHSGEYQKQLANAAPEKSELLATIPDQTQHDLHLPPMNKPDPVFINNNQGPLKPAQIGESVPDYHFTGGKVTAEWLERQMNIHFGENMPTIHDDKKPGRDAVNYPRHKQQVDTPATRHHFIPESWFQFFYPKTGLTGPYTFIGSFGTFLLSKEWIPIEHEFLTALSTTVIFTYAVIKFGPGLRKWMLEKVDKEIDGWDHWQQGNIATLNSLKKHYEDQLKGSNVISELYNARKQDVEMQIEAERRRRVKMIYEDTKRRLNYLVAVAESQRQIHQANMTNWVMSNVLSSIGPKQENEVLDNCISNLKQLASKNANAI